MMGDFTKPQYVMRRQALEEELQRTKPPVTPALDRAKALLEDFGTLWQAEQDPVERRKLIATLFEQIWQRTGRSWPSNPGRPSPATSRPWRRRGQNAQKPV
jgi:hypothetical protein